MGYGIELFFEYVRAAFHHVVIEKAVYILAAFFYDGINFGFVDGKQKIMKRSLIERFNCAGTVSHAGGSDYDYFGIKGRQQF